jgi:hypothetical protein
MPLESRPLVAIEVIDLQVMPGCQPHDHRVLFRVGHATDPEDATEPQVQRVRRG